MKSTKTKILRFSVVFDVLNTTVNNVVIEHAKLKTIDLITFTSLITNSNHFRNRRACVSYSLIRERNLSYWPEPAPYSLPPC